MMITKFSDLGTLQFNTFSRYEPVGCTVYVLTSSGEILKGQRKCVTEGYNNPNAYYRVLQDGTMSEEIIKNPIAWAYS